MCVCSKVSFVALSKTSCVINRNVNRIFNIEMASAVAVNPPVCVCVEEDLSRRIEGSARPISDA